MSLETTYDPSLADPAQPSGFNDPTDLEPIDLWTGEDLAQKFSTATAPMEQEAIERAVQRPAPSFVEDEEVKLLYEQYPYYNADERLAADTRFSTFRRQEQDRAAEERIANRNYNLLNPEAKKDYYALPEVIEAANRAKNPNDMWARKNVTEYLEEQMDRPLLPGEYEPARDRVIGGEIGQPRVTDAEALNHLTKKAEETLEFEKLGTDMVSELTVGHVKAATKNETFRLGDTFENLRAKYPDQFKGRESAIYGLLKKADAKAMDIVERNRPAFTSVGTYLEHVATRTHTDEERDAARDALLNVPQGDRQAVMEMIVQNAKAGIVDKGALDHGLKELTYMWRSVGGINAMGGDAVSLGVTNRVLEERDAINQGNARIAPDGSWFYDPSLKVPGARKPTADEAAAQLGNLDALGQSTQVLRELTKAFRQIDKPPTMFSKTFLGGIPSLIEGGAVGYWDNFAPMALASSGWGTAFYMIGVGSQYTERMLADNPGMNPRLATGLGLIGAGFERFTDAFEWKITTGMLTKQLLVTLRNKGPMAFAKQLQAGFFMEAGAEGVQDFATAAINKIGQTIAHDIDPNMDVGKIESWGKISNDWIDQRPEVLGQVFVGSFIGSGIGTYRHLKDPERLLYNPDELKRYGLSPKEIDDVLTTVDKGERDTKFSEMVLSRTPEQIAGAKILRQEDAAAATGASVSTEENPQATLETEVLPDGRRVWHVLDENGERIHENLEADVAISELTAYQTQLDREAIQQQAEQAVSEEEVARTAEAEAVWEQLPAEDKTTAANIVEFSYAKPESPDQQRRLDLIKEVVAERNKKLGTKDTVQLAVADVPSTRAGQSAANFINWFQTAFGKRVQFVGSENGQPLSFTGMVAKADPNTIFLNVAGNRNILSLVGHEWSHTLEKTNPQLWASVVTQIKPLVVDWAKEMGKIDSSYDADQATPEFIANVIGDAFGDPEFWARVKQKDAGLFQRMLDAIKQWFDTITDRFSEYQTQAPDVIKDWESIRNIVAAAMEKAREGPEEVLSDEEVRQQAQASNRRTEKGFYSKLEGVVTDKLPKSASPEQAKATINGAGIKAEEIKWSGAMQAIDRIAAENNGKVPKGDLVTHLEDEGSVKFEEVTLRELSGEEYAELQRRRQEIYALRDRGGQISITEANRRLNTLDREFKSEAPKFGGGNLVLPGGENYREVVLAMPSTDARIKRMDELKRLPHTEENIAEYNRLSTETQGRAAVEYTSSHFPNVPNYVAHMRLNDREGGLFIEEIQSDRHQQGREKGYKEDYQNKELVAVDREGYFEVSTKDGQFIANTANEPQIVTPEEAVEWARLRLKETPIRTGVAHAIPDAPFRKDWPLAMFKRALRDAVATGMEWIGWTTGETQAERYDLSKQVDEIRYQKKGDSYELMVFPADGQDAITKNGSISEISDYVGKEIAEKIQNGEGEVYNSQGVMTLKGETDLKVGGEGMKGFYDNILPKEVGKYVKQWGGKVEKDSVSADVEQSWQVDDTNGVAEYRTESKSDAERFAAEHPGYTVRRIRPPKEAPIWKVEITPQMKEGVAAGQAQFSARRIEAEPIGLAPPKAAPAAGPVTITAFDPALMGFAERDVQPSRELLRQLKAEARICEQLLSCLS